MYLSNWLIKIIGRITQIEIGIIWIIKVIIKLTTEITNGKIPIEEGIITLEILMVIEEITIGVITGFTVDPILEKTSDLGPIIMCVDMLVIEIIDLEEIE